MATRPAPPVPGRSSRDIAKPPTPKSRIGQYTIERTLGAGSFGKVKLATHGITGHWVALKFLNRVKIDATETNARVKREIQYLTVLRHPHIIKLYEVITTPTDIVMVMEYAGQELFNYIVTEGKGGMHESDARRFFQQMMSALEYCHSHNIVHRDLKPENLFLDARNNIKIGDFGLSNLMTDGDFLKTSCGSPNYAAPEVISGKLYSGPEIDVWSAGVIMYVLLVGVLPFDDDHIPSLFKKIESGSYKKPAHLSEGALYLLKRMLHVDPVKRATIAEIRSMPYFQEGLPRYLQPLPEIDSYPTIGMDDLSTLLLINEGQTDPRKVAEAKGLKYSEDLGVIEPEIVEELLGKLSAYTEAMVWDALLQSGVNSIKVAYQLVRDHKRILKDSVDLDEDASAMDSFMASSPPAWNAEIPRPDTEYDSEENDWDEDQTEIQDIPDAHFDILETSTTTTEGIAFPHHRTQEVLNQLTPTPVQTTSPQSTSAQSTSAQAASAQRAVKTAKPKWHFGIRSRSPPMEVMLEIYKTLDVLGMEWKNKDHLRWPEIGPEPLKPYSDDVYAVLETYYLVNGEHWPTGEPAPTSRSAQAARDKAAQELYLVETRHRYGDVMVRMDLQLYRVDRENYLVDFKNIGYYRATETEMKMPEAKTDGLSSSQGGSTTKKAESIGGVSGPFHFLEMACAMITELASG